MTFIELNIVEPILRALKTEGYLNPTPIQEMAIPAILQNKDLLGSAQTGTGKTAAFAIPILQKLSKNQPSQKGKRIIKSLILTPTRELALQIGDSFSAYGRHTGLKHTVIYGGVSQKAQTSALQSGTDILIATPGRLLDLYNQGFVNFRNLSMFVLDEADRMLDMGFLPDITKLLKYLPANRQSLFFSATMPPEIVRLSSTILKDPVHVEITPEIRTAENVRQFLYHVNKKDKRSLLVHLLQGDAINTVLVFTRTKYGADKVAKHLIRNNIMAESIHGNKSQHARQRALSNFKKKQTRVLVATDIASRGIDVDNLSHVINFDIPEVPETYVHRIGRTGRAGLNGTSISFCDREERLFIRDIHKLINKQISLVEDHPYPVEAGTINDPLYPETGKSIQQKRSNCSYKRKQTGYSFK